MEIKVKIGDSERVWGRDADTSWFAEQIRVRQENGVSVCVVITINGRDIDNLIFAAGECGGSRGGSGTPNYTSEEMRVIETWKRIGVSESPVNPGKITAFMQQISRQ